MAREPDPEPGLVDTGVQTECLPVLLNFGILSAFQPRNENVRVYVIWRTPSSPWGDFAFTGVHLSYRDFQLWSAIRALLCDQEYRSG
eukprot:3241651-Amphidinium_carterae.1